MKFKKITLGMCTVILSTGLLFGCGTPNDEQEPDPTEEPSEQNDQGNNQMEEEQNQSNDEQEPDPTEEPSEQNDQGNNEIEEEQNQNQ